jgi:hypothetical protein
MEGFAARISRVLCLIVIFSFSIGAAAGATKTVRDKGNHCEASVPGDWSQGAMNWHSPSDMHFTLELRGFFASEVASDVDMYKKMHGTVIEENGSRVLLSVPVAGGRKQIVSILKTEPLACRATVTVADPAKDAEARKIADSLKTVK